MRTFIRFISIPVLSLFLLGAPYTGFSQEVDEKTSLLGALHYAQEVFGCLEHLHTQVVVDCNKQPQAYMFVLCDPESPLLSGSKGADPLALYREHQDGEGIVTVLAGANTSHTPVIQMHRGWPDYVLNMTRIMNQLEDRTATRDWEVADHIYPAPLELWVEMRSSKSGEHLFVRASDVTIVDQGRVDRLCHDGMRARGGVREAVREERIRKKWEFVQGLYEYRGGAYGEGAD